MATKVQETKKETTKEDQEMMDFIKLSYDIINDNLQFLYETKFIFTRTLLLCYGIYAKVTQEKTRCLNTESS